MSYRVIGWSTGNVGRCVGVAPPRLLTTVDLPLVTGRGLVVE